MLEAVIFDFDGVLLNTPKYYFGFMKEYLANIHSDITDEDVRHLVGRTFDKKLEYIRSRYNIVIDKADFVENTYTKMKKEIVKNNISVEPVAELLSSLKARGIKLGIASNNGSVNLAYFLEFLGLNNFFDAIVTIDMVDNPKPCPDSYLLAAEQLRVEPASCVGVEDTIVGVRAVKKAGMKSVGLANGFTSAEELASADLVVKSISELNYEVLRELF